MPATPPGGRYVPRTDAGTPFWAQDPQAVPAAPPVPSHPPLPPTDETIPKDASPLTLVRCIMDRQAERWRSRRRRSRRATGWKRHGRRARLRRIAPELTTTPSVSRQENSHADIREGDQARGPHGRRPVR